MDDGASGGGAARVVVGGAVVVVCCGAGVLCAVVVCSGALAGAGDAVRVVLTFGTGTIEGGTTLSLTGLAFAVQCAPRGSKMLPCVAGGPTGARYLGDATLTTTCSGVTWASTQRGNKLLLIPSTPIVIPSSTADFCDVEFDLGVTGARDLLGEMVEAGFDAPEVRCDNGLRTAVLTEGAVAVQQ